MYNKTANDLQEPEQLENRVTSGEDQKEEQDKKRQQQQQQQQKKEKKGKNSKIKEKIAENKKW